MSVATASGTAACHCIYCSWSLSCQRVLADACVAQVGLHDACTFAAAGAAAATGRMWLVACAFWWWGRGTGSEEGWAAKQHSHIRLPPGPPMPDLKAALMLHAHGASRMCMWVAGGSCKQETGRRTHTRSPPGPATPELNAARLSAASRCTCCSCSNACCSANARPLAPVAADTGRKVRPAAFLKVCSGPQLS